MPVKPVPKGYHTVTSSLAIKGAAKLIESDEAGDRLDLHGSFPL